MSQIPFRRWRRPEEIPVEEREETARRIARYTSEEREIVRLVTEAFQSLEIAPDIHGGIHANVNLTPQRLAEINNLLDRMPK